MLHLSSPRCGGICGQAQAAPSPRSARKHARAVLPHARTHACRQHAQGAACAACLHFCLASSSAEQGARDRGASQRQQHAPVRRQGSMDGWRAAKAAGACASGLGGTNPSQRDPFRRETMGTCRHACRQGSVEGARPARLALARVSLVRGQGPLAGQACVDDYLRPTEPVADYLTQWSGLQPGDLDRDAPSRHGTPISTQHCSRCCQWGS